MPVLSYELDLVRGVVVFSMLDDYGAEYSDELSFSQWFQMRSEIDQNISALSGGVSGAGLVRPRRRPRK